MGSKSSSEQVYKSTQTHKTAQIVDKMMTVSLRYEIHATKDERDYPVNTRINVAWSCNTSSTKGPVLFVHIFMKNGFDISGTTWKKTATEICLLYQQQREHFAATIVPTLTIHNNLSPSKEHEQPALTGTSLWLKTRRAGRSEVQ